MEKLPVTTSVQVTQENDDRRGQAGCVVGYDDCADGMVNVRFDVDNAVEQRKQSELRIL